MSRSVWKGPFVSNSLYLKAFSSFDKTNLWVKKVWSRSSFIPKFLVDKNVYVYNGKLFKKIYVSREKVGFKFGDFSFSRNYDLQKVLKKKEKKKEKKKK